MLNSHLRPLIALLILSNAACSSETSPHLVAAPKKVETATSGQNVSIVDSVVVVDAAGNSHSVAIDLLDFYNPHCPDVISSDSCDRAPNSWLSKLCEVQTRLALARPLAQPVSANTFEWGTVTVRTTTAAQRAIFAIHALVLAQIMAGRIDYSLRGYLGVSGSVDSCGVGAFKGIPRLAMATTLFTQAYHLAREAADVAVEEMVNVGDSGDTLRAGTDDVKRGFHPDGLPLNRAGAAMLLAGGLDPFGDSPINNTFCTQPELSPDAKAALAVFRDAAPSPTVILSPTSTNELLNDWAETVPDGSVAMRLFDTYQTRVPGRSIQQHYGLSTQSFNDARNYLKEELKAFRRSALQAPPRILPGGRKPVYRPYAGLMTEPQVLDAAYYYAIARTPPNQARHESPWNTYPPDLRNAMDLVLYPSLARPMADFVEAMIANAHRYLTNAWTIGDASLRNRVMSPLALLTGSGDLAYRIEFSTVSGFWLQGLSEADKVLIVRGEDNLRCATTGTSEGGVCTTPLSGYKPATPFTPYVGYSAGVRFSVTDVPADRYYVLKPFRNQSAPGPGDYKVITGLDLRWESRKSPEPFVALVNSSRLVNPSYRYLNVPVVPWVQQRVRELLAPSRTSCKQPKINCVFSDLDDKIPLEDELTGDADGVESSWKHYVALARAAANQADTLAEEYINSGLRSLSRTEEIELREEEQHQRALATLAEVREICGADIDFTSLLKMIDDPSWCGWGATCSFSTIVTSLASAPNSDDPDLQRLSQCLSLGTQRQTVSLGKKPLCYWTMGTNNVCNSNPPSCTKGESGACAAGLTCVGPGAASTVGVCQLTCVSQADCPSQMTCVPTPGLDAPATGLCKASPAQCPKYVESGVSCTSAYPKPTSANDPRPSIPAAATIVGPTTALGFFDSPADTGGDGNPAERCNAIAIARKSLDAASPYAQILQRNSFMHPYNLAALQGRLDWEGRYGGYSAVLVDGVPKWTTGDPFGPGPGAGWPCAQDVPSKTEGLFSRTFNCTTDAQRAQANYLLLRAVLGARALASLKSAPIRSAPHDQSTSEFEAEVIDYTNTPPDALTFWNGNTTVRKYTGKYNTGFRATTCPTVTDNNGCTFWIPESGSRIMATNTGTDAFGPFSGAAAQIDSNDLNSGLTLGGFSPGKPLADVYWRLGVAPSDDPNFTSALKNYASVVRKNRAAPITYTVSFIPLTWHEDLDAFEMAQNGNHLENIADFGPGRTYLAPADSKGNSKLTISLDDVFNGLELMCRMTVEAPVLDFSVPPKITTVDDLTWASQYVRNVANNIRQQIGLAMLSNVPPKAVDALRAESAVGSYPQYGGRVAEQISAIRSGLLELQQKAVAVADEVTQIGYEIGNLHDYLKQNATRQAIADLQFSATMSAQLARCGAALASAPNGLDPVAAAGNGAAAAIACADSIAQINFAEGLRDLTKEDDRLQSEIAIGSFGSQFSTHVTNMRSYALQSLQSIEAIEGGLAELENLSSRALAAVTRAAHQASSQAKTQAGLTHAIGVVYGAKQVRYTQALINAKRLAVLAKRAIEQRLGRNLSSMKEPLPLVDAPALWEKHVCVFQGVNTTNNLGATWLAEASSGNVAGGFIGDYVTKLENVVESYRLANNFHEGTDVAIVSLKNDIMNIREMCPAPGPNLLYASGNFGAVLTNNDVSTVPGWTRQSCVSSSTATCIHPQRLNQLFSRFYPNVPGYALTFGSGATLSSAGLVQTVSLDPGTYRFSWFTPDPATGPGGKAGKVQAAGITTTAMTPLTGTGGDWNRIGLTFTITQARAVTLGFFNQNTGTQASPAIVPVRVGGAMLELLPPASYGATSFTPYSNTTASSLDILQPACEDKTGATMRAKRWRRDCVRLCPDGFGDSCGTAGSKEFCYREAKFDVNQRDLQFGRMMQYSGFARGNFNYRIDSIGLNFVGTNPRECSDSLAPNACYSAGFIPYSLYHNGPFYVRNETGDDFRAPLFDGAIEHARGLAIERYITNPISDTDRGLLQDYMRLEFNGRPLDGNFVIRVWEEPGVNFEAVEDVQIVLNYRYWTRFE